MDLQDLAKIVMKLDRNKAPVDVRSRNKAVWEIEAAWHDMTPKDEILLTLRYDGAHIRWDGISGFWNGENLWGSP